MLGELHSSTGAAFETARLVTGKESPMSCNVAWGCNPKEGGNGCRYCYGKHGNPEPMRYPEQPVADLIAAQLAKGLRPEAVFFSFHTDPWIFGKCRDATAAAHHLLRENGITPATLTKQLMDDPLEGNRHGWTVPCTLRNFQQAWEPESKLSPFHRIENAAVIHEAGGEVWFSMEPFPCPTAVIEYDDNGTKRQWQPLEKDLLDNLEQTVREMAEAEPFLIIFGKMNYWSGASTKDARPFYARAVERFKNICAEVGINGVVKSRTLAFVENNGQTNLVEDFEKRWSSALGVPE